MSAPKRPKLDFGSMLGGSRRIVGDAKQTDTKIDEITSILSKYQSKDQPMIDSYRRLVGMCTEDNAEVVLVLRLGLGGLDCLRTAMHMVPEQYLEKRFNFITDIVNKVLERTTKQPVTVSECEMLAQVCAMKISPYMKRHASCSAYDAELLALTSDCETMGYGAFLSPPIKECITCKQPLHSYTPPTKVTVFEISGPRPASKISLRCSKCKTNYNYSMFGNKALTGERYYDMEREYIEASDVTFVSRELHQLFATLSVHCWVSFSGFAECLYECWHIGTSHDRLKVLSEKGFLIELTRKHVSNMFYNAELENELSEDAGVVTKATTFFRCDRDRESLMAKIEENRVFTPYPHEQIPSCQKKGCGQCWSVDGNWKLGFTHCMYPVSTKLEGFPKLRYPDVCTDEPKYGKAFCDYHCSVASKHKIPCDLKEYLKYRDSSALQPEAVTSSHHPVAKSQGTEDFIKQNPNILELCEMETDDDTTCKKDTGEKARLQLWSRGHFFIVRPCGHVDHWKPLYRSESPSQVFIITVSWLLHTLKDRPESEWKDVVICYDNMCHLDALKVAREDLPLDAPYDKMWKKVTKIIDSLHIKNHTDSKCIEKYHPKTVKDDHPSYNLMCAEQVFTWLSRFKRITCSMNKTHHCFFIHRIVKRRNIYTSFCNRINRCTLLPGVH